MNKRTGFLWTGLLAVCFVLSLAAGQKASAAGGYTIDQYDVQMNVSEDNTYYIEETIEVNFQEHRHGIYRNIPLKNDVKRADGSTSRVMAQIKDVSCHGDEYSLERSGDRLQIKIGDEDHTIIGSKTYVISYQYVMGNDVLKDADELYYNLIGAGWEDTTIHDVSFTIQMPKEFDENNLGFSYGPVGSEKSGDVWYYVEGNTITGMLDDAVTLGEGDALTVRLTLPEGYFLKTNEFPVPAAVAAGLAVLTILLSVFLWNRYGKDDPVVERVEFYPPEGINSAEASYLYYGRVDDDAVISLIPYMAQKGYLTIRDGQGVDKKGFVLNQAKLYDGTDNAERMFMAGLFKSKNYATQESLKDSFYETVGKIQTHIKNVFESRVFYANSLNKEWILYLLFVILYVCAFLIPAYRYTYDIVPAAIWSVLPAFAEVICVQLTLGMRSRMGKFVSGAICAVLGIILFGVVNWLPMQYAHPLYKVSYILAVITGLVVGFFAKYMDKRTPYGNEMLGQLMGFKTFLETAEKDRLQTMVEDDPQYFYDILPFTYIFGISDLWMKKFESIATPPPAWYDSEDVFRMSSMHHFIHHTMSEAKSTMLSQPSSSGSSGGGFSGGGSGGGGGGSW